MRNSVQASPVAMDVAAAQCASAQYTTRVTLNRCALNTVAPAHDTEKRKRERYYFYAFSTPDFTSAASTTIFRQSNQSERDGHHASVDENE